MPHLSLTNASILAARLYGLTAVASDLPSERDQNLLLQSDAGDRYILKLANAAERRDVVEE